MYKTSRFGEIVYLVSEIIVIVLYYLFTEYADGMHPGAFSTGADRLAAEYKVF